MKLKNPLASTALIISIVSAGVALANLLHNDDTPPVHVLVELPELSPRYCLRVNMYSQCLKKEAWCVLDAQQLDDVLRDADSCNEQFHFVDKERP